MEKLVGIVPELGAIDSLTALVGVSALALILVLKRTVPQVPASLVAVVLGIAAVSLFDLADRGLEIVGHIDSGLPRFSIPDVSLTDYLDLIGPAVGVLLIGFAEGLGAAKTYAAKSGYEVDVDRELLGMGAANLGSGVLGGMVVNGSLSKTAVNGGAGARSQLSGMVVAILTAFTLLFLTGLFENLPEAVLSAVVIAAVIELVNFSSIIRLYKVWSSLLGKIYHFAARADFLAAVGALVGVLVFDTLPGLFIGITLSLVAMLYRSSRPHVARLVRIPFGSGAVWADHGRHPDVPLDPDVVVVRVESSVYFANADHVRDAILACVGDSTRAVVLDAETTPSIDVSGGDMLLLLRDQLRGRGVELLLAKSIAQLRDVVDAVGLENLGTFETIDDAVASVRRP